MAESQQAHGRRSLYSRLGGVYSIATVVEDLIDRVMVDPDSTPIRGSTRRITA